MILCRQKYQYKDFEMGLVDRCPECWDDVLKQVSNSRCKACYGTGYSNGGYRPPFITWGSIMENSPQQTKNENPGIRTEQSMTVKLPCPPIFRNEDVFVEVRRIVSGQPLELGRIYEIGGSIKRNTVQGWVSTSPDKDTNRDTVVEDMIISQEGGCRLLLPSDPLYLWSEDFWGVEAEPYIGYMPPEEGSNVILGWQP